MLIYTIPLLVSWGAVALTTRAFESCTGSPFLPTSTVWEQVAALFVMPVLMYAVIGVVVARSTGAPLMHRLAHVALVAFVVAAMFVWFRVRYYSLDTATCADGLPVWWPEWLPAR